MLYFIPCDRPSKAVPPGKTDQRILFLKAFPVEIYLKRTESLRGEVSQLRISYIKQNHRVTPPNVTQWTTQAAAGIDSAIFNGHSVRGASTSAAAIVCITTNEILEAVDQSSDSSLCRFTTGLFATPRLQQQFCQV